jgi:hypothetical protein
MNPYLIAVDLWRRLGDWIAVLTGLRAAIPGISQRTAETAATRAEVASAFAAEYTTHLGEYMIGLPSLPIDPSVPRRYVRYQGYVVSVDPDGHHREMVPVQVISAGALSNRDAMRAMEDTVESHEWRSPPVDGVRRLMVVITSIYRGSL